MTELTQHEVRKAADHANDLVVRRGILALIDQADDLFPKGVGDDVRACVVGAQRAAWVVRQVLDAFRLNNPIFRAVAGAVVGVVYLIVALVYRLHRDQLRRRRTQRSRGRNATPLKLRTELVEV